MKARRLRAGGAEPDRAERATPRTVLDDHGQADSKHAHGEAKNGEAACHDGHLSPDALLSWDLCRPARLNRR